MVNSLSNNNFNIAKTNAPQGFQGGGLRTSSQFQRSSSSVFNTNRRLNGRHKSRSSDMNFLYGNQTSVGSETPKTNSTKQKGGFWNKVKNFFNSSGTTQTQAQTNNKTYQKPLVSVPTKNEEQAEQEFQRTEEAEIAFDRLQDATDILKEIDTDRNGKANINELSKYLNEEYLNGQNDEDKAKIQEALKNVEQAFTKYADKNGELNRNELANLLYESPEMKALDNLYRTSSGSSKFFMDKMLSASGKDSITSDDLKSNLNKLIEHNKSMEQKTPSDPSKITAFIDKCAGDDGKFSKEEFHQMINSPEFKQFEKECSNLDSIYQYIQKDN